MLSCLFVPLERILGQAILLAMLAEILYQTREDGLKVLESGRHSVVVILAMWYMVAAFPEVQSARPGH